MFPRCYKCFMKAYKILASLFLIIGLVSTDGTPCFANSEKPKVTLLIHLDLSGSLKTMRPVIAQTLSPIIEQAMINDFCEIQVAVADIKYRDRPDANLRPIGFPEFVTNQTPNADQLIRERITTPFEVAALDPQFNELRDIAGGEELTYSSLAEFIKYNAVSLQNQDTVASLLITDAAPAYETMSPDEALNEIYSRIGRAVYFAGVLANRFEDNMLVKDPNSSCQPDFPAFEYGDAENLSSQYKKISPQNWVSKDIFAIDRFVELAGGVHKNICTDDHGEAIRQFVNQALAQNACLLLF